MLAYVCPEISRLVLTLEMRAVEFERKTIGEVVS